jgi:hypothetical protein
MGKKNDMYNEITRLKAENERLREMLQKQSASSPSDTSVIDDAEFVDTAAESELDEESKNIYNMAKRFASKLNLGNEDLSEMVKELKSASNEDKAKYRDIIESGIVRQRASSKLSEIISMELAGKSPTEILKKIYRDEDDNKDDNRFVDRLTAKLRDREFPNTIARSGLF